METILLRSTSVTVNAGSAYIFCTITDVLVGDSCLASRKAGITVYKFHLYSNVVNSGCITSSHRPV
jgi:hypothetical protein